MGQNGSVSVTRYVKYVLENHGDQVWMLDPMTMEYISVTTQETLDALVYGLRLERENKGLRFFVKPEALGLDGSWTGRSDAIWVDEKLTGEVEVLMRDHEEVGLEPYLLTMRFNWASTCKKVIEDGKTRIIRFQGL